MSAPLKLDEHGAYNMKKIILTSFSALAVSAVLAPTAAIAHGYVAGAFPSRVNLCHSSSGSKNNCASASYDRPSLQAPKGFPAAGLPTVRSPQHKKAVHLMGSTYSHQTNGIKPRSRRVLMISTGLVPLTIKPLITFIT